MKKYMYDYIDKVSKIKNPTKTDIDDLLIKIKFFSHERLIHLIVTMFIVLFSIIFTFIYFYTKISILIVLTLILYILDLFYILHYYFLENGVQKLYIIYDNLNSK